MIRKKEGKKERKKERKKLFLLFEGGEDEERGKKMGKDDEMKVEDVEEGEISDTASVEEITEEDFNKHEVVQQVAKENKPKEDARVWTVQDIYTKYPTICGGYGSGLYNLAWAQAVQNKPLNDIFVMDVDPNDKSNSKRSSPSPSIPSKDSTNSDRVVIDVSGDEMGDGEKEEGELEEGEIDLDSETSGDAQQDGVLGNEIGNAGDSESDFKTINLDKQLKSIREALDKTTEGNVEKLFEEACTRLQNALETLVEVFPGRQIHLKDVLVQMSFSAIKVINSVFCSMNVRQKKQRIEKFSRLLSFVNNKLTSIFPTEHMNEIQSMVNASDSLDSLTSTGALDKENKVDGMKNQPPDVSSHDARSCIETPDKENKTPIEGLQNQPPVLPWHDALSCNVAPDKENKIQIDGLKNQLLFHSSPSSKLISSSKSLDHVAPGSSVNSDPILASEVLKHGISNVKGRGITLPLLDLHKDHDEDSLPSPTREAPSWFSLQKAYPLGDGMFRSLLPNAKVEHDANDLKPRLYETDALKAVSTYQQKFGRSSLSLNDKLPSPTPSQECDNGDGDTNEEVSSSAIAGHLKNAKQTVWCQPAVSSISLDSSSIQTPSTLKNVVSISSSSHPIKGLAKSRDPRLRFVNSDSAALNINHRPSPTVHNTSKADHMGIGTINSRKQRIIEEPSLEGPASKRQKNELESTGHTRVAAIVAGTGGWLEEADGVELLIAQNNQLTEKSEMEPRRFNAVFDNVNSGGSGNSNATSSGSEQIPVTDSDTTVSLPALLKDIAVNPTMLLNILMGQQQRLVEEVLRKSADSTSVTHPSNAISIQGSAPTISAAPSKTTLPSLKSPGMVSVPLHAYSLTQSTKEDPGKIRMKPRDPRRILHGGTLQKTESLGSDQFKAIAPPALSSSQGTGSNVIGPKLETDKKLVTSPSAAPPDITRQFTNNLKNIADIMSVPRASANQPIVTQGVSSVSACLKSDKVDLKSAVSSSEVQHMRTSSATETRVVDPSQLQSMWGDVEHLFEGYDDQQKAAIHRERTRRIEEQKKMFAGRKLCLVLDLDHTLLNSAKFVEVDPVHDEILRKKEEQDREKPQRHLFRFSHMGMWTKLRPGIWNFLEKASKLYELHLYTMGNKLYATEMAKVLDPRGVLFAGRVISRGDDGDPFDGDERVPKSKDLEGVLGMESAVVIIDDSVRVWPHNKLNLIVVERYTYFPCSRRQFGLLGPSLLEIDHDERPEDGTLASSLAVIERIHKTFFSHHSLEEVDVRNILASEQRKILAGCRIVFSRVFPVGEANPHLHPLWQTAEQFGAVCTNQIDEQVTHVVANSLGTDKVNWALSTGKFVVHPGWVEASALLYRRANEQDFSIKP